MTVNYLALLEGTTHEERLWFSEGSDGYLYAVGWTLGNFGENSVSDVNTWDAYLMKINILGSVEWTKLGDHTLKFLECP